MNHGEAENKTGGNDDDLPKEQRKPGSIENGWMDLSAFVG